MFTKQFSLLDSVAPAVSYRIGMRKEVSRKGPDETRWAIIYIHIYIHPGTQHDPLIKIRVCVAVGCHHPTRGLENAVDVVPPPVTSSFSAQHSDRCSDCLPSTSWSTSVHRPPWLYPQVATSTGLRAPPSTAARLLRAPRWTVFTSCSESWRWLLVRHAGQSNAEAPVQCAASLREFRDHSLRSD